MSKESIVATDSRKDNNFLRVNRTLRKLYGNDIANLIASLKEHIDNLEDKEAKGNLMGRIRDGGFVYFDRLKLADKEAINVTTLDKYIKVLVDVFKLFKKELHDTPPKIYIALDRDVYAALCDGTLIIESELNDYQKNKRGLNKKKTKWDNPDFRKQFAAKGSK